MRSLLSTGTVRTRFAPAPTGTMHIGNVRTALFNYIFARQKNGACILRIEDTDQDRNYDPQATQIQEHLAWMGISYNEGPMQGGNYGPYFQSQRNEIYTKYLDLLIQKNIVYRCFATPEELEQKRQRQMAMKMPPRYDRAYANLTPDQIQKFLDEGRPFVWRVRVDSTKTLEFTDLARGTMHFDLKNFSDFPITRQDGSFTFIFANCIDDITMQMTHVFRGEDHLTNTVYQAIIYQALQAPLPTFWHMPILCNTEGKKLSKRDRGFSLEDVKQQGFLPEAVANYLALIGSSFPEEIFDLETMIKTYNFEHLSTAGQVKYDIEKLIWVNNKWINKLSAQELTKRVLPFLMSVYPQAQQNTNLEMLISKIQTDLHTLAQAPTLLKFYFDYKQITKQDIYNHLEQTKVDALVSLFQTAMAQSQNGNDFLATVKSTKLDGISPKEMWPTLRYILTENPTGIAIIDAIECMGFEEAKERIMAC
jgi:glutamyl-tRNA synthetase